MHGCPTHARYILLQAEHIRFHTTCHRSFDMSFFLSPFLSVRTVGEIRSSASCHPIDAQEQVGVQVRSRNYALLLRSQRARHETSPSLRQAMEQASRFITGLSWIHLQQQWQLESKPLSQLPAARISTTSIGPPWIDSKQLWQLLWKPYSLPQLVHVLRKDIREKCLFKDSASLEMKARVAAGSRVGSRVAAEETSGGTMQAGRLLAVCMRA